MAQVRKFVCVRCEQEFTSESPPGVAEAELEQDFPGMSIDDCAIVCDDCYQLVKPFMTYDELKKKLRKSLADDYRRMRYNGQVLLARLLWRAARDTERKVIDALLYGDPGAPPGGLLN